MVQVLDQTSLVELQERESWPEALVALQQQGQDLDTRAQAMRCDPATVQEGAFAVARLDAEWGTDYFHLAYLEHRWIIMNVIWQTPEP